MSTETRPHQTPGTVDISRQGPVAVVTLCRERKLNALSTHMESALAEALDTETVRTSRAIVLTGGATVFSAGADTEELRTRTAHGIAEYYRGSGAIYETVAALPQPTVAAIAGYCVGGGLELALACDLRVADATAQLALPEITRGILPSSGGITRLVRTIGPARTRDLVLRGRRMDAAEAHDWGLFTETTPANEHLPRATTLAGELANHPPQALEIAKQVITTATDAPRDAALLAERLGYTALNQLD